MSDDTTSDLEILDRATCLRLLGTLDVGRCAWVDEDGRVVVMPVNFAIDSEHIIFRSAAGGKLAAAAGGQPFSFEGDDLEPAVRGGWSVLVQGQGEHVTDQDEKARLAQLVQPWSRDARPEVIRLRCDNMTGRRLTLHSGGTRVAPFDFG